jgi:NAD(P)-dependent dehydrogenase (short-subunit alcohol dehydrogenase family)
MYAGSVELSLRGKTALITGSSRGIGLAIARRFAEAGANVMLSSRKSEALVEAATSLRDLAGTVAWHAAHVGDSAQAEMCVNATIECFGGLDILVNNAATSPYFGPILEIDEPRLMKTVEVNQSAIVHWSRAAWDASLATRGGCIINVASIGAFNAEYGSGWYNTTKAAMLYLTKQLAYELGPAVRVNALAPGLIKTEFARAHWEPREESIVSRIPLRRLGEPDDIATAALFLASDAAKWITGQTLVVDGGSTIAPNGTIG